MRNVFSATLLLALLTPAAVVALPPVRGLEVRITNMTQGQVITPPLFVVHGDEVDVFEPGQPASEGLARLAEDGDFTLLLDELRDNPEVFSTLAGGPVIGPGMTERYLIPSKTSQRYLTIVGMFASTNDAFFGLDSYRLSSSAVTVYPPIWDAGSEFNSESCAYIPGPPCGNPGARDTAGAEGFVSTHAGIHGVGDLDPVARDWNHPSVRIVIGENREIEPGEPVPE